ncbi:DUF7685 domain-containing protein [Caballeronia sp. LjRoot31]|uniref:DUF7685 domain-containing protein n=1 Tax=Caballeronia sp. LjRoot31 TaxID=3342324 RepID=UPI003ECD135F
MSVSQCAACGTNVPPYETVNTTNEGLSGRLLCTACFNREMAHHAGIDNFGSIKFEPVHLNDASGVAHEFHFRTLLFGDKRSLESFESTSDDEPSGYRLAVSKLKCNSGLMNGS